MHRGRSGNRPSHRIGLIRQNFQSEGLSPIEMGDIHGPHTRHRTPNTEEKPRKDSFLENDWNARYHNHHQVSDRKLVCRSGSRSNGTFHKDVPVLPA